MQLLKEMEEAETTPSSTWKKIGAVWQGLGNCFNNHKKRKFALKDSYKESYYGLSQKNTTSSSSAIDVSASSTLSPAALPACASSPEVSPTAES